MPGRIEDYALVGDLQSVALVCIDGSIDWLCFPRFDSPACLAALLGDERHGSWRLAPDGAGRATRRDYRGDTLVLDTEWETDSGTVRVTDFMPQVENAPNLVRIVEGVRGSVNMRCNLTLRFDYGKVVPWMRRVDGQLSAVAGPDSVWLSTPVKLTGRRFTHVAEFTVSEGERVPFVLTWHPSYEEPPQPADPFVELDSSLKQWNEWARGCTYQGQYRDAVIRSMITLRALTYRPTGGVVAAATTSLPEALGGDRNWDYRYCWLRDATFTLEALLRGGYYDEARAWRQWLLRAVAGSPQDLQIMYGVAGERRLLEWEADWLPGYEDSAPVRIGNAAVQQLQLDVYGEVLDVLHLSVEAGGTLKPHMWAIVRAMLDLLERRWHEPDEGLWEMRGGRKHFVHSKLMAWAAFDRALRIADKLGYDGPLERWRRNREEIHAEICEKGYDAQRNTFTQYYGTSEVDAALLMMIDLGFLPPTDERVIGTVDAVQHDLVRGGFVLRYRTTEGDSTVDGLQGNEGTFLACSFWLADALLAIGREDDARELFERLLSLRNDVGLLAEEYDPAIGRQLGNFPQAYSHVALARTAFELSSHDGNRRRPRRPQK